MDTRQFGGKVYRLYTEKGLSFGRVTADRIAGELRRKGYKVRLVKYGRELVIYRRK